MKIEMILAAALAVCLISAAQAREQVALGEALLAGGVPAAEVPAPAGAEAVPDRASAGNYCCDGAACAAVAAGGFGAIGVQQEAESFGSALRAYRDLTAGEWFLTFPDGTPLTDGSVGSMFISRKDLAGGYSFDVGRMSVLNRWWADPALGISSPGQAAKRIGRVCFAPGQLVITAEGARFRIDAAPRAALVRPAPNSGAQAPVTRRGYLVATEYGNYLFSR